jgi:hypothetical protein
VPPANGQSLLSVQTYRLLKPYRPALFGRVAGELDRAQQELVAKLDGRIERRRAVFVAGRRARQYDVAYRRGGEDLRQRVTYVLAGRREHVVTCRWAPNRAQVVQSACGRMLATFRLRS